MFNRGSRFGKGVCMFSEDAHDRTPGRLTLHPVLEFNRGRMITFYFEGEPLRAYEGETIAAALHAAGVRVLRFSPRRHRPRGFFCAIGKCSACLMIVDGKSNVRSCITLLRDGMQVARQEGKGRIDHGS